MLLGSLKDFSWLKTSYLGCLRDPWRILVGFWSSGWPYLDIVGDSLQLLAVLCHIFDVTDTVKDNCSTFPKIWKLPRCNLIIHLCKHFFLFFFFFFIYLFIFFIFFFLKYFSRFWKRRIERVKRNHSSTVEKWIGYSTHVRPTANGNFRYLLHFIYKERERERERERKSWIFHSAVPFHFVVSSFWFRTKKWNVFNVELHWFWADLVGHGQWGSANLWIKKANMRLPNPTLVEWGPFILIGVRQLAFKRF